MGNFETVLETSKLLKGYLLAMYLLIIYHKPTALLNKKVEESEQYILSHYSDTTSLAA